MSRFHAKAGDYAAAMETNGVPKVCGYRHRKDWGACRGKVLQRDHVDELQDAPWQDPKKAWVIFACEHHHQCKTNEKRAEREAKREGRMAQTAPRLPKAPGGKKGGATKAAPKKASGGGWGSRLATFAALVVLALIGVSYWFNITDPVLGAVGTVLAWVPLVLMLMLAALGARYGPRAGRWATRKRREERSDWLLAQAAGIARKMQCAPDAVEITPRGRKAWTREGLCIRGRVTYPAHVLDDDPKLRKAVEDHWRHKLSMPGLVIGWNVGRNWFDYCPLTGAASPVAPSAGPEVEPPPETDSRQKADDKLTHVMESVSKTAKGDWSGTLIRHDAIGPLEVEIVWPPDFKAAADESRVALMETINLGLPGRWRADSWEGESRTLHITRRPKLERFIPNPGHVERVAWHLLPLGRAESGETVCLDVLSIPHALFVGATRRGKSVGLRTIIFDVLNPPKSTPAIDVPAAVLLDPKEVEFAGFEGMPNVVEVATEDAQMANAVDRVFWEMRRRYRWKKRHGVPLSKHRPVFLVIDEYQEFVEALNDAWIAKKGTTGKEHPSVAKTRRIARLGAAARIFIILATQRPDADWFKGSLRENIQYRFAFGKLSPEASRMAFSRTDVGRDIPDKIDGQLLRGRGNTAIGDDGMPREFQAYWTPNPDEDEEHGDADRALLAMLIPRQRDGLGEPMWDLDRLLAEFAGDDDDDDEAGAGTSRSRGRGTVTKTAPAPRQRQRQARPQTADVRMLRLSITQGAPRWVMDDGERVQVVAVEPDETAADHWLVTVASEDGARRDPMSLADGYTFVLAEG